MRVSCILRLAVLFSLPLAAFTPTAMMATAEKVQPAADRITVTTVGSGPDVVLIPGLASSAHVWERTADHLMAHYRGRDVAGSGFAGPPAGANASGLVFLPVVSAIHDYILANHLQGTAVIGHSVGGLIAMKLAIDHPGDAGRVMIVDSLPFFVM